MCVDQYWYNGKGDALQDLGSEMSMKYGLSGWGGHFSGLDMFVSDVPGVPEFFKKKVPGYMKLVRNCRYEFVIDVPKHWIAPPSGVSISHMVSCYFY
jgi:hypothetical protein